MSNMQKSEAELAAQFVKEAFESIEKKYDYEFGCFPAIEVQESDNCKGWFGVKISTDGDSYEMFYDGCTQILQTEIMEEVSGKMGEKFIDEGHYFEAYGSGIVDLY